MLFLSDSCEPLHNKFTDVWEAKCLKIANYDFNQSFDYNSQWEYQYQYQYKSEWKSEWKNEW